MTLNRLFLRGLAVGFFLCLTGSLAFGATRTWVSGALGSDTNSCSRTAPCATSRSGEGQAIARGVNPGTKGWRNLRSRT